MAAPMPKHPHLRGNHAPSRMESTAPDCIVHGEIPGELRGTFYRNGPDPQFAPRGMHHWFAGDGMIHAFHIENGRLSIQTLLFSFHIKTRLTLYAVAADVDYSLD